MCPDSNKPLPLRSLSHSPSEKVPPASRLPPWAPSALPSFRAGRGLSHTAPSPLLCELLAWSPQSLLGLGLGGCLDTELIKSLASALLTPWATLT